MVSCGFREIAMAYSRITYISCVLFSKDLCPQAFGHFHFINFVRFLYDFEGHHVFIGLLAVFNKTRKCMFGIFGRNSLVIFFNCSLNQFKKLVSAKVFRKTFHHDDIVIKLPSKCIFIGLAEIILKFVFFRFLFVTIHKFIPFYN